MTTPAPEARHQITNLLATYTAIADRKDVDAAVDMLGRATVIFPRGGFSEVGAAHPFFAELWASPIPSRHDVSNLIVAPLETVDGQHTDTEVWRADAQYVRWLLDPEPLVHTLGNYQLDVTHDSATGLDQGSWRITALTITHRWTRA